MHKDRMVQKIDLLTIKGLVTAITEAGFNTFLLNNRDVFLDMLINSE
jgi:tryptophanase